ncbi:hypothetical protein [uncultured Aquimarina sp.]|uniref:hypothetical protein n=1 Tax=uncultured Aquimarina sp. TaxID=575652 RepID=UPI002611D03E|nr:hypothetical protein [uncultured Aquimarina sp.]
MKIDLETLRLLMRIGAFVELITVIIGTFYFYKYKNTALKYILLLFWYTVINDLLGVFYLRGGIITDYNAIIYNIYNVISFTYLLLLYRHYIQNKIHKKAILLFSIIYLISFVINGFFENYLIKHQRFPYIIAAIFLVISISLYFIEILNSQKVLNAKRNLLFWISVGFLIFFVGNLPFRILTNYYLHLADATISFLVKLTLTIIMNICFIIGFIWSDKKQQY